MKRIMIPGFDLNDFETFGGLILYMYHNQSLEETDERIRENIDELTEKQMKVVSGACKEWVNNNVTNNAVFECSIEDTCSSFSKILEEKCLDNKIKLSTKVKNKAIFHLISMCVNLGHINETFVSFLESLNEGSQFDSTLENSEEPEEVMPREEAIQAFKGFINSIEHMSDDMWSGVGSRLYSDLIERWVSVCSIVKITEDKYKEDGD